MHGWPSSQSKSNVSAMEYYIAYPTYGPGSYSNFQKILFMSHFFLQLNAVKVSDESRTTLQQFWKDYNIYKGIKNSDFAWCEFTVVTMNVFWKNLYLQFFHDFENFEKFWNFSDFSWIWGHGWGIQRYHQQLTDLQWVAGSRSGRGPLHWTLCWATQGA